MLYVWFFVCVILRWRTALLRRIHLVRHDLQDHAQRALWHKHLRTTQRELATPNGRVCRHICLTAIRLYVPSASCHQHASPRASSLAKPPLPVVHSEPGPAGDWPTGYHIAEIGAVDTDQDRGVGHVRHLSPRVQTDRCRYLGTVGYSHPPTRRWASRPVRRTLAAVSVCWGSPAVRACSARGIRPNVSSSISHSGNASRSSAAICARPRTLAVRVSRGLPCGSDRRDL